MNIQILSDARVICSNRNSIHNYFAWPSVTKLSDGRLAMVASGFRLQHICPFGKGTICYSSDEGKTWTHPAVLIDTPLDDRDCGITVFGEKVIVTSFTNTIEQQRKWNQENENSSIDKRSLAEYNAKKNYIDAYLSMVNAEQAESQFLGSTYVISDDGGKHFGPVQISPVTSPHGPTVTPDQELIYVGFNWGTEIKPTDRPFISCYKIDKDLKFHLLGTIPNVPYENEESLLSCEEPHAIILPSGKILVHIRVENHNTFTIYQSESTDGGKTFSVPRQLLDQKGGAPAHLLRHSSGTLISTYGYREEPCGIRVMLSDDDGENWNTDHILFQNDSGPDVGYPASVELEDGSILTVFYAHETKDSPAEILQVIWKITP